MLVSSPMSKHKSKYQTAIQKYASGSGASASWIGFREVRETLNAHYARDAKIENVSRSESCGVMIEAMVDGFIGYSATPYLTQDAIDRATEAAIAQAELSSRVAAAKYEKAATRVRPSIQMRYESKVERPASSLTSREICDRLIGITRDLKTHEKIARTQASIETTDVETYLISSSGSESSQSFHFISSGFSATAQDSSGYQERSDGGLHDRSYQGGFERFDTADLKERVRRISEEALELLSSENCPDETCDLLIMPDQMMLQIHESVGHPLELDRILGDERNYAGWSFVKPSDFGKLQYGSKLMNITYDPTVSGEFASFAYDDIGNRSERQYIIQEGKLLRGLGSLESQARLNLQGVACSRASSWNRPPIDRMANLNLEPGASTFASMIASIEKGVLMTTNRSWSIDDFRNKFQFGCEYAKRIENGKIVKTLKNPNYRGISVPFWNSLAMIGDRSTFEVFGTPNCGKGEPNQAIKVGHASPACLFKNVEVFGGAA